MSLQDPRGSAPEVARALALALDDALSPAAERPALEQAKEVAGTLGLSGLERLLAATLRHVDEPWPLELASLVERVRAVASACLAAGEGFGFLVDPGLGPFADELAWLEWRDGIGTPGVRTPGLVSAAQALADLPLASDETRAVAQRTRLAAPIAGALRAAVDWLARGHDPIRAIALRIEDSTLEAIVGPVGPAGVRAATAVVSSIGGSLGPDVGAETSGSWVIRVPAADPREIFLMVVQGGLRIALPWHAVLKLRMLRGSRDAEAGGLDHPVLQPLAPLADDIDERPVALLGLGLKRAYFIADRLVWRLAGTPLAVGDAPQPSLGRAVQSEDGDTYWVADVQQLLREIEPAPIGRWEHGPVPRAPLPAEPADPPVADAPALDEPMSEARPERIPDDAPEAAEPAAEILPELGPADVRPLTRPRRRRGRGRRIATPIPTPLSIVAPGPTAAPEPAAERSEPAAMVPAAEAVPASSPAPAPVAEAPDSSPGPAPVAEAAPARRRVEPPVPSLEPGDVPMPESSPQAAPVEPAPATQKRRRTRRRSRSDGADAHAAPAPGPERSPSRGRVLVAEDSIAARIFLTRLLEQRGFQVLAVSKSVQLVSALEREDWALVCVDIELPDRQGLSLLRDVRARAEASGGHVVVLVRDGSDVAAARAAGLTRILHKPVEPETLDNLLLGLGLRRLRP